jgi:phosphoenolpyruvate phosphomutase
MKKNYTIYAGMAADLIHYGHINLIIKARKYGSLIIGILSDEAVKSYKRDPVFNYKQRKLIFKNIKGVSKVVKQDSLSYKKNLLKYKPDYVIHGDDWKSGVQNKTRQEVIECLKKWGGRLIEVKYTKNISTSLVIKKIKNKKI